MKRELLQHLVNAGIEGIPRQWFDGSRFQGGRSDKPEAERGSFSAEIVLAGTPAETALQGLTLEELATRAHGCRLCRLCETRNHVVFGAGNTAQPLIAFVGEGPGADEDRTGEPFVGRAGELLTAAITKGLGLAREDVYICTVVKCSPPENRTPLPDEVVTCLPYLFRQLELISPRVIVTLGPAAQSAMSGVELGVRGQWQSWRGIKVMPTFHPAYLLQNPAAKKEFWADLQAVMREVGLLAKGGTP